MAATRLIRTLLLAVLFVATAPAMANAAPAGSFLTLTIHSKNGAAAPRSVVLNCDPDSGTHPRAKEACNSLRTAHGDFTSLSQNHANSPCPLVLRPVIVKADGTWRGKPVRFRQEFGNECEAAAKLGPAYSF